MALLGEPPHRGAAREIRRALKENARGTSRLVVE
jgi:hypothetical protein